MLTTNKTQSIEIMHKKLDKFIQSCLNKFKFVEVKSDIYTKVGKDKNSIISHKSTIPDLVIWNKSFNKCDCFKDMKDSKEYYKYPRVPFFLRTNNKEENNKNGKNVQKEIIEKENNNCENLTKMVNKLHLGYVGENQNERKENENEIKTINNCDNINNKPINQTDVINNDSFKKDIFNNINYINQRTLQ